MIGAKRIQEIIEQLAAKRLFGTKKVLKQMMTKDEFRVVDEARKYYGLNLYMVALLFLKTKPFNRSKS